MSYGGMRRGERPREAPGDPFDGLGARPPGEVTAPSARVSAGHRRAGPAVSGPRLPAWFPVTVVLAVQAALSLWQVRADSAFEDEAAYLWAGHLEWSHWLHGTPIPHFPAYFSGAPVIYPPLAAAADSLGGLTAARVLSLVCMLGVTLLLWATASRLAGRRAAFFASALFAVAAPTVHLGSFATYDALALLLTSLAAWLVVRAAVRPDAPGADDATGWMAASGACLALANATAYTSVLLDPVVIGLALVTAFPRPGGKVAAIRVATITVVTGVLLTASVLAGGSFYLTGISSTTLGRVAGTDSPLTVAGQSWSWTGLIAVAALCGLLLSLLSAETPVRRWLFGLLTVAALIIPAEQARLHTTDSLAKHVDAGIWFAAIAAGYAADKLITAAASRHQAVTAPAVVVALAFPLTLGASQARALATAWPDSTSLIAILGQQVRKDPGRLLVEDPSIAEYYLAQGQDWERWSSTRNITLPGGASTGGPSASAGVTGPGNAGTFAEYITSGYFSLVALNFADTTALDHQLAADLRRNHRYHLVEVIPYGTGTYVLWQYEPRA
ncbi:MAG TPA: glycosyltransferase family 39 protein [Streptosporangiaceae bacterium]|nr:glycosyltransferase family 39 protein [Streptosporangiaceae bacterium]